MPFTRTTFMHLATGSTARCLIKTVVVVGLLFLASRLAPLMSAPCLALTWAGLSAVSAIGIAYHAVIRKTHRQVKLRKDARLSKLNGGRALSMLASFVAAAVFMAGFIMESPKWETPQWLLVAFSAPLFAIISAAVGRHVKDEYELPYRSSRTALWSSAIVGVLMCAAYAGLALFAPAPSYASAADAYLSVAQPYADSPSSLMLELGKLMGLSDGLVAYGMAKAGEVSFGGYLALHCVSCASAFFGIANLLGMCAIEWPELKRVFLPLSSSAEQVPRGEPMKSPVALAIVLPLCLAGAFCVSDAKASEALETEGHTAIESFVREQIDMVVYLLDGKYYEQKAVDSLLEQAEERSATLSQEARESLVPLINESFDARVANVDAYLDWYYSLPADYERLLRLVVGSAEDYAADQFSEKIEEGIDDSQLAEMLESYVERAEELQADLLADLAQYEVKGVPAWLMTVKKEIDASAFEKTLEPTQRLLDAPERLGVSAVSGVVAGVVAKRLVKRVATKPFFKAVVSRIGSILSSRAAGAAVGGAAGSIGGPAGTAVGVLAGTGVSVGVDYVLLMADEYMNRDSYRDEIVSTIEDARADMLSLVP